MNSEQPSKQLVDECKSKVERALSSAVKVLFDDEVNGGDFYAHILMQMYRIFDDKRIPTAAVSITNKINLYINSYFFVHQLAQEVVDPQTQKVVQPALDLSKESDKLLLQQRRAAVIKHEILHCIFHHMSRGRDFGNPTLANFAADFVVNSNIDPNILGKPFLYPQDFGMPKDKSMDWYYQNYPIEDHPLCDDPSGHRKQYEQNQGQSDQQQSGQDSQGQSDQQQDDSQDGQGQGGQGGQSQSNQQQQGQGGGSGDNHSHHDHSVGADGKCKTCGGLRTFDNHEIWNSDGGEHMSDAMKESLVKDAVTRAAEATKNAGNLPQSIQEMIALAKKKPQIPWQSLLRQFVSRLSNGVLNHTKKRPSKRFKTYPGTKIQPKLKLAVCIDISGSISDKEYEIFLNEIFAIAKHTGEVEVVEWDTKVQGTYKIKGYKPNITRLGSGGTCPKDAIKWVNDRKNKFDGCVFFTDGYFYHDEVDDKFRIPAMFVITADGSTNACKKYRTIKLPKTESDAA